MKFFIIKHSHNIKRNTKYKLKISELRYLQLMIYVCSEEIDATIILR